MASLEALASAAAGHFVDELFVILVLLTWARLSRVGQAITRRRMPEDGARYCACSAPRSPGQGRGGDELVARVLMRSVVDEHVDATIDIDLEWRREVDRPSSRRTAFAPDEHSITRLHRSSVIHRRVSENDAEYRGGPVPDSAGLMPFATRPIMPAGDGSRGTRYPA